MPTKGSLLDHVTAPLVPLLCEGPRVLNASRTFSFTTGRFFSWSKFFLVLRCNDASFLVLWV